jgi:hypothetical protein
MCGGRWARKTKAWLLFNLENEPNTHEKIMNNKLKYLINILYNK